MAWSNTRQDCVSALVKTSIFPKALPNRIWAFTKKPSHSIPRLLTQASISNVLDSSPVMASSTEKEHTSCWDSRRKLKFRAADQQSRFFPGPVFSFEYHFTRKE